MKIAIVGTGRVGAALGRVWAEKGHMVTFASREPEGERAAALLDGMPPNVSVRSLREAVAPASVVVLAVPYSAVAETIEAAGDLSGKILVDCTNPIAPGLRSLVDESTSGAEQIAQLAPRSNVIKAFNTTGAENMANPSYRGQPTTMFVCGDDLLAKTAVIQLSDELGFATVDAGPLPAARHLENLARFWIHLASVQGLGRQIAFTLEQR